MLLDTHTLVWAMMAPEHLSRAARTVLEDAETRCVSAASLYEIAFKARLGKWPEVSDLLSMDLDASLRSEGITVIPATGAIMERAGRLDWAHRDPFDRIIVATALDRGLTVISKDETLDTAPEGSLTRLW